jgi:hypothetical protein
MTSMTSLLVRRRRQSVLLLLPLCCFGPVAAVAQHPTLPPRPSRAPDVSLSCTIQQKPADSRLPDGFFMDFKVWRKEAVCEWSQYAGKSMPCEISDTAYKVATSGVFAGTTITETFTVNRVSAHASWLTISREANGRMRDASALFGCKLVTPGTQKF